MISGKRTHILVLLLAFGLFFSACGIGSDNEENVEQTQQFGVGEKVFYTEHKKINISDFQKNGETYQVMGMCEGQENELFLSQYSDEENSEKTEIEKVILNEDGIEFEKICDLHEEFSGVVKDVSIDEDENLYLLNGENTLYVFDNAGSLIYQHMFEGIVRSMTKNREGDICIVEEKNAGTNSTVLKINLQAKQVSIACEVPIKEVNVIYFETEESLYVSTSDALYQYDISQNKLSQLTSWVACNVKGNYIKDLAVSEDSKIFVLTQESMGQEPEIAVLSEGTQEYEKEILTLVTPNMQTGLRNFIVEFNKSNPRYFVQVRTCANADYADFITRLNTEILAGEGPDIIDLTVDFEVYAQKGVLEDLGPYLENSNINRADYLPTAFEYFEKEEKCYGINAGFVINTLIGDEKQWRGMDGWNLEECMTLMESTEQESIFCGGMSKNTLLICLLENNMAHFIDEQNFQCSFNSEEFQKLLEFVNKYGAEENKMESGLVHRVSWNSVLNYVAADIYYEGQMKMLGYPTDAKNGTYLNSLNGFGMSANSTNKEGVWEFFLALLSEEYQESGQNEGPMGAWSYQFPVKRSGLELKFITDNKMAEYNDYWGIGDYITGVNVEIAPADRSQMDELIAIMESAPQMPDSQAILDIICEEAESYFAGGRSVSQTMDAIQSRARIYISEKQ